MSIRLCNVGTTAIPLDTLALKYWYSKDGTPPAQIPVMNSSTSPAQVTATQINPARDGGTDFVLTITFPSGELQPNGDCVSEMDIQVHATEQWTKGYDMGNDWSYLESLEYVVNTNLTLENEDRWVWGNEPGATDFILDGSPDDCSDDDDVPPLEECVPSEMEEVNVIVFRSAEPTGGDVEGKMYVGGNLTADSYATGMNDPTLATDCSEWGLVVGGTLDVGGGTINGKVAYGVDVISAPTTPCGVWNETPVSFVELETKLTGYSIALSQYEEEGTSEAQYGNVVLTGADPELNVFNVTADEINTMTEMTIDVPEGSSVIVNISGDTIVWSGGGFNLPDGASCRGGSSDWCHRILYNMYEAQSITLNGAGIQGSILAPRATLEPASSGSNIDGQMIVEYLYGGIEYHAYFFEGCLLLPW